MTAPPVAGSGPGLREPGGDSPVFLVETGEASCKLRYLDRKLITISA